MSRTLYQGIAVLLLAGCVFAQTPGHITGTVQTATSGTINNGTLTFTLSQPSVVSGTATLVTQPVACYTSNAGSIVGVPDPIIRPILSTNTGSGTLAAGTYFVEIYYTGPSATVSAVSPEASVVLTSTGTVIVQPPALQPANATGYGVAISATSGTETIQGTVSGFASQFQQSSALIAGSTPAATNNSVCNLYLSDELIPTGTYYSVNLVNKNGSPIAGYPQSWCTYGGSGATINVSQGAPTGNCNVSGVFYPTPILSSSQNATSQSISTPMSFAGNATFTGQINCKSVGPHVKCVDSGNTMGWAGSDIGAWINAADAAITSGAQGEIWVFSPTQTNATTQISIGDGHSLKNFGHVGINAPILIGKFGNLECTAANSDTSGLGSFTATQNMTQMARMRVQDGSLVTMYINGCIFNGGGFTFTRGIIDLTGMNDRGSIGFKAPLILAQFQGSGGGGLYLDDCPNGTCAANAGSGHTEIGSVWVNPSNGGASSNAPCMTFLHSNTAGSTPLGPFHITSLECQMFNDTSTYAILIQNNCTSTCGSNQWQFQSGIYAHEIEVDASCAACDGIKIDGVFGMKVDNMYSFGGNATSNAVHVTNNANNLGIHVNNIQNISAGLAYKDDILGTSAPANAKQVREFTAGAQTTGSSLWNSFDERPYWGNLVGIATSPPGLGVGTQRYGCYANSTLFGISCSMNGITDVSGLGANAPVWLGTVLGHFMIDSGGAAGFQFRTLNTSESFTGISASVLLASGSAAGITGTGACATITTIVGAAAGSFKCTGTTGAATVTITPGQTATNGWYCGVQDETTRANLLQQTGHNATTCTLTATTVTQNDVFVFSAVQAF